jgi:hypothetical protein
MAEIQARVRYYLLYPASGVPAGVRNRGAVSASVGECFCTQLGSLHLRAKDYAKRWK